ncbi:hypothetical protein SSX86_002143 [Deinandra increscens subsp. villosa]|uniref:Uncharacterized protein n=1 Tax=Deinandra increscens subsp. villosa TaxID=3103831 RepID=A0AAP0DN12_9ASTR
MEWKSHTILGIDDKDGSVKLTCIGQDMFISNGDIQVSKDNKYDVRLGSLSEVCAQEVDNNLIVITWLLQIIDLLCKYECFEHKIPISMELQGVFSKDQLDCHLMSNECFW